MGTQTLIQALQAIPWSEVDEGVNDKDDSDENDADNKPGMHCLFIGSQDLFVMVCSIRTILVHTHYSSPCGQNSPAYERRSAHCHVYR
jgi:hypothetical protein